MSAAFLGFLRPNAGQAAAHTSILAELRAGWQSFRSRTWLGSRWRIHAVPRACAGALAGAWAAISTALGVGAVAGGVLGLRWRPRRPLRAAFLVFLIAGPPLFLLLAAQAPLAVIVLYALIDGASGTLFNVFWFTALQRDVPPGELSRVSS